VLLCFENLFTEAFNIRQNRSPTVLSMTPILILPQSRRHISSIHFSLRAPDVLDRTLGRLSLITDAAMEERQNEAFPKDTKESRMPDYKNNPLVSVTDDTNTPAVQGVSSTLKGIGVSGRSTYAAGVIGTSEKWIGAYGESQEAEGVRGVGHKGAGVSGSSEKWIGTYGESQEAEGVRGVGHKGAGVSGKSEQWIGVYGESTSGVGVQGKGGRLAGLFEGDVEVTGDLRIPNADCAEDFNICSSTKVEPGTVMVLGEEDALFPSQRAYDKRVAGVISGAGDYKPGIVLDKQESKRNRQPIALLGKVYCKADAQYGSIEVGDLLTTSSTPGHAMRASEPLQAFGAVLGKALRPLKDGQGLIPILIALQ
jgi:hypothetical protein